LAFRGFFELNDVELTNTSRVVSHLGMEVPTQDIEVFGADDPLTAGFIESPPGSGLYIPASTESSPASGLYDLAGTSTGSAFVEDPPGSGLYSSSGSRSCVLEAVSFGLFVIPASSSEALPAHPGMFTVPDGAVQSGPLLFFMSGNCWDAPRSCSGCRERVEYDDSWPLLRAWRDDPVYRTELAPWFTIRTPESAEFLGVWVMNVKGLEVTPTARTITEMVGSGATAGFNRDPSRTVSFEAILVACTNAGLEYGLDWLVCRLRETTERTDSALRYFTAHPSHTAADPEDLVREVHGVVLKTPLEVTDLFVTAPGPNRQANMARVTWEFVATRPYSYAPPIHLDVVWDEIQVQPVDWVAAQDCTVPDTCAQVPVMVSATCPPQTVEVVSSPPPSCGGGISGCDLETFVYYLPSLNFPLRCHETAISMSIQNLNVNPLTLQGYWRPCIADPLCGETFFPFQLAGLPSMALLVLDGISARYWATKEDPSQDIDPSTGRVLPGLRGRPFKPVGIVGTPSGAPWTPPIIDREDCWQLVVIAVEGDLFEITLSLADREA